MKSFIISAAVLMLNSHASEILNWPDHKNLKTTFEKPAENTIETAFKPEFINYNPDSVKSDGYRSRRNIWKNEHLNRMMVHRLAVKKNRQENAHHERKLVPVKPNSYERKIWYECMMSTLGRILGHGICKRHAKISV